MSSIVQSSFTTTTRNSTGSGGTGTSSHRNSFIDARMSIGSNRLSLLPTKNNFNNTAPILPTPQIDSEELIARTANFLNDFNNSIQKIKTKIAENTEQWVQDTAEVRG